MTMCSFIGYWIAASFSCFISKLGRDNSSQCTTYLLMRLLLVEDEIDIQSFCEPRLKRRL